MCDQHERDIQEMAGSLKSLKERVTALEQTAVKCNPNTALAWATKYHEMENRIDVLEGRSEGLILSPIQVESKVAGLEAWQSCAKYQIENLEHQMRNHYHSGNVWVESEDGSESVMQ